MSVPLVSVVLPARNAARFLPETLRSALAQTLTDFELLVLDNASSDGTGAVVREFADARLSYRRHVRDLGFTGNISYGFTLARGRYVAVLGADDVWAPEFLERTVRFLEAHPGAAFVHTDAVWIDEDSRPFGESAAAWPALTPGRQAFVDCFRLGFCFTAMLMRAQCIQRSGGVDANWSIAADLSLFLRLCLEGDAGYLSERLVWYRYHRENLSTAAYGGYGGGTYRLEIEALDDALSRAPAAMQRPEIRQQALRHIGARTIRTLHLRRLAGWRWRWAAEFVRVLRTSPLLALRPSTWARFAFGLLPRPVIVALQRRRHSAARKRLGGLHPPVRLTGNRIT